MTRHIADKRAAPSGGRERNYLELDRRTAPEGSHPAVKSVMRRPADRSAANRRTAEFIRIERGERA